MKQIKSPEEIPEGHHYAILSFNGETEMSSVNMKYFFTHNRDEWVEEIRAREENRQKRWGAINNSYAAVEVAAKASITIEVKVK